MQSGESILPTSDLPRPLAEFIRRFVVRSRQLRLLRAAGLVLTFILIWTLAWALFDRLIPMPALVRATLSVIEATAAMVCLVRPIRRWLSPAVPWQRAAAAIEDCDPQFGGGLQTALSQLLMPARQRGSTAMLERLVADTASRATNTDPRTLLPSSKALGPATIAGSLLAISLLLLALPWLDLPRLLKRQLMPFANAAPVTTTQLLVTPGSVDLIEGDPLKITVRALRLGDSQPLLQWRGDDPVFSSAIMLPQPGGFSYTFNAVDRAITYRVSGGDAVSPLYHVNLVPRPSVRRLRVSYAYPAWTELPSKGPVTSGGDLGGPIGTIATLSVLAGEPISDATAVFNGTRIRSAPSVDPSVRLLTLPLHASGSWHLELTSAKGVSGNGPSGMSIHVVSAQPPRAILRLPSDEEELRLHPRDILTLAYEASDAFALSKIVADVGVNDAPPVQLAIPLGKNHRVQSGSLEVDLAQLNVRLGDVVSIVLTAQNKAGLRGVSNPARIVISPQSIDLNAQQRLAELREAARLATVLRDQAAGASEALAKSPPGDDKDSRDQQISPHLAMADGVTSELTRQLLRAITHSSSPELAGALVWMVDANQRSASRLEAADAAILTEPRDALRTRLGTLTGGTTVLQQSLDVLWRGEFATQLLARIQDAKAEQARLPTRDAPRADEVRRWAQHAREDEQAGCKTLGIDPSAADVEAQLQSRVQQSLDVVKRFGPIDFAAAASEWSTAGADAGTGLVARLTVASEAEAIRPSGDYIWARDLQLSARAARRIDTSDDLPPNSRRDYPSALRALQRVHGLLIARLPFAEMAEPMKTAEEARHRMRFWAGDWAGDLDQTAQPAASQTASETKPADTERAELEIAAARAEQKLEQEAQLDHISALHADLTPPIDVGQTSDKTADDGAGASPSPALVQELQRAIAIEKHLERLADEQRLLRRQTATASDANLQQLATRQAALTKDIQSARAEASQLDRQSADQPPAEDTPTDSRESAMNAIRSAQERLLEMPSEIASARQTEVREHDLNHAAEQAEQDAAWADPEAKDAADQVAAQAQGTADAAAKQAASAQVSPDESARLSASLRQFAPETTPSVDAIDQQLTPSLTTMRQTQSAGDDQGNQRGAQEATEAVAEVQRRLNAALQTLLKQDALTAARFFSSNAAKALAKSQPDRAGALRLQRGASAALEQSWDNALHQGAGQRLAQMPALSSILRLYPAEGGATLEGSIGAEPAPVEREWGRLHQLQPEDLSVGSHETDPPEYQDALRVYFRDLAREDAGMKQ
jgi:hypothetical protein